MRLGNWVLNDRVIRSPVIGVLCDREVRNLAHAVVGEEGGQGVEGGQEEGQPEIVPARQVTTWGGGLNYFY